MAEPEIHNDRKRPSSRTKGKPRIPPEPKLGCFLAPPGKPEPLSLNKDEMAVLKRFPKDVQVQLARFALLVPKENREKFVSSTVNNLVRNSQITKFGSLQDEHKIMVLEGTIAVQYKIAMREIYVDTAENLTKFLNNLLSLTASDKSDFSHLAVGAKESILSTILYKHVDGKYFRQPLKSPDFLDAFKALPQLEALSCPTRSGLTLMLLNSADVALTEDFPATFSLVKVLAVEFKNKNFLNASPDLFAGFDLYYSGRKEAIRDLMQTSGWKALSQDERTEFIDNLMQLSFLGSDAISKIVPKTDLIVKEMVPVSSALRLFLDGFSKETPQVQTERLRGALDEARNGLAQFFIKSDKRVHTFPPGEAHSYREISKKITTQSFEGLPRAVKTEIRKIKVGEAKLELAIPQVSSLKSSKSTVDSLILALRHVPTVYLRELSRINIRPCATPFGPETIMQIDRNGDMSVFPVESTAPQKFASIIHEATHRMVDRLYPGRESSSPGIDDWSKAGSEGESRMVCKCWRSFRRDSRNYGHLGSNGRHQISSYIQGCIS